VFEAIREANAEMGKFGVQLRWNFRIETSPITVKIGKDGRPVYPD
jgi:hypothetical protein